METKISFGFSKITKKPNLLPIKQQPKEPAVELIKCIEGQEIKPVEEKKEAAPLIIPLKDNTKTSAALASLVKRRAVLLGEDDDSELLQSKKPAETNGTILDNETLEQRAARELMNDISNNEQSTDKSKLVLPIKPDELPLDGAKESNLDDYENIPIQHFGMAMLRGMGFVEPVVDKSKKKPAIEEAPMVRPKGMGLGADKAIKPMPLLVQPAANEVLEIKKQAYVRILGGKSKDLYGQIEGFDDHAGRVIVKMSIGGSKQAFNEFLCQPVTKKEYTDYGKCINTTKYEEYKKMENEHGQIIVKPEPKHERTVKQERDSAENRKYEARSKSSVSPERKERKNYDDIHRERSAEKSYNDKLTNNKYKSEKPYYDSRQQSSRSREDKHYAANYNDKKYNKDSRHYDDKCSASSSSRHCERYYNRTTDAIEQRPKYSKEASSSRRARSRSRSRDAPAKYSSSKHRTGNESSLDSDDDSDSDSDSAYERRKAKSKKTKKSKSKKSKSKQRRHSSSESSMSSSDSDSSKDDRKSSKKHKKKTKKSKKQRSR